MVNDLLIMQSHGAPPDHYEEWLATSGPIHERYAAACDADYTCFVGLRDGRVHPAWNRLPMFLDAFAAGYRKVVWLDADTLVVDEATSIFAETDDTAPLQMRTAGLQWQGEDCWNDGVLVANNCPAAVDALQWVWDHRHARPRSHHAPSLWELNWLLDYVFAHRDIVVDLDQRFNWMPFADASPEADAVICAWHGMPHADRFAAFQAKALAVYG